jgi:hypothetical protein
MASLMIDIEADVAIKWVKQDQADQENDDDDDKDGMIQQMLLKVKGVEGDVKISMNTAALENKLSALNILRSLAQQLGKGFDAYVDATANMLLTKVVTDKTSRSVVKEAYKMFSVLISCCESQEKML